MHTFQISLSLPLEQAIRVRVVQPIQTRLTVLFPVFE